MVEMMIERMMEAAPIVFGLIKKVVRLIANAVASLAVGPDKAVERMADSWIEQATGQGVNLGYHPVVRDGVKVAAVIVLIIGWLLISGIITLIVLTAIGPL